MARQSGRANKGLDVRRAMLRMLLEKIAGDRHPSIAHMNMVEQLLTPDEIPMYAQVLMDKVRDEAHPSIAMLNRLNAVASAAASAG